MNRRLPDRRSITSAVLLLALLLTPANIFSCGPSFPEPVFTVRGSPDAPLKLFVQGRLGIVLPTYERTYLVVAYRYLSGRPPNKEEETAFEQAWAPQVMHFGQPSPPEPPVGTWEKARIAALAPIGFSHPEIDPYRGVRGGWQQYLNCGNDAFLTAANTVTNLTKTFGVGSEPVRDWVQAQDTVFENCKDTAAVTVTGERAT